MSLVAILAGRVRNRYWLSLRISPMGKEASSIRHDTSPLASNEAKTAEQARRGEARQCFGFGLAAKREFGNITPMPDRGSVSRTRDVFAPRPVVESPA
jgi:hypothetical protein